jgi:hypothetical protein
MISLLSPSPHASGERDGVRGNLKKLNSTIKILNQEIDYFKIFVLLLFL